MCSVCLKIASLRSSRTFFFLLSESDLLRTKKEKNGVRPLTSETGPRLFCGFISVLGIDELVASFDAQTYLLATVATQVLVPVWA